LLGDAADGRHVGFEAAETVVDFDEDRKDVGGGLLVGLGEGRGGREGGRAGREGGYQVDALTELARFIAMGFPRGRRRYLERA
jgi:hypothetical protein